MFVAVERKAFVDDGDRIITGPFDSYEEAEAWSKRSLNRLILWEIVELVNPIVSEVLDIQADVRKAWLINQIRRKDG